MTITSITTRLLLAAACFCAAFTAGTIAHAYPASAAPAFYGLTPGQLDRAAAALKATPDQEAAACAAVYHYHHVNTLDWGGADVTEANRAWLHAWHLAGYADPEMRRDIRHYLYWGTGWSLVRYDCNPDEGL